MKPLTIAGLCLAATLGWVRPAAAAPPPNAAAPQPAATPARPDAAERTRLTAIYQRAQEHYLAKRYTEALPLFQQVAVGMGSPNAWLYVARCQRQLGRPVLAHRAMRKTVKLATAAAADESRMVATRDAAQRELRELDGEVGHLRVRVPTPPTGLDIKVNGETLATPADAALVVAPGAVSIVALAPQRQPLLHHIEVAAGAHELVTLRFPSAPPPPEPPSPESSSVPSGEGQPPADARADDPATPPKKTADGVETSPATRTVRQRGGGVRVAGIVVLGLSALSWAGFGVTAVMADRQYEQLQQKCNFQRCTDLSVKADIDVGRGLDYGANGALGLGIATSVVGSLMVIFGGATEEVEETGQLSFTVRPDGAALQYRGTFTF